LIETGTSESFWVGSYFSPSKQAEMKKVVARNKKKKTEGDSMELVADCGQANETVVGGDKRAAVYSLAQIRQLTSANANPTTMRTEIMKKWLEQEQARRLNAGTEADSAAAVQIAETLAAGQMVEDGRAIIVADFKKAASDAEKDLVSARFQKHLEDVANAYWKYYDTRPASERNAIDKELKINRFARPDVGQGYAIATGGPSAGGDSMWNFHWGGVVMTSDDRNDTVVLENYATSDPDEENTKWTFETYGTLNSAQSFHARHKNTGQHGLTPTTMAIKKL
jgi:hypothetical protein